MSGHHTLAGRSELELMWMQRRSFMQAACVWTAMGGFTGAQAQQCSNIVELTGDALLNGQRLLPGDTIQSGDAIKTGPKSNLIFVLGNSSFQVRQNSHLVLERGASLSVVSALRLLTGAVVSVWGKGTDQALSQSDYHQSFWAEPVAINGRFLFPAKAINHNDEELEALAGLVNQRTNWQILGKKGLWDGRGYMEDQPGQKHPAELMAK